MQDRREMGIFPLTILPLADVVGFYSNGVLSTLPGFRVSSGSDVMCSLNLAIYNRPCKPEIQAPDQDPNVHVESTAGPRCNNRDFQSQVRIELEKERIQVDKGLALLVFD